MKNIQAKKELVISIIGEKSFQNLSGKNGVKNTIISIINEYKNNENYKKEIKSLEC